ncbi:carbonic anhydrase [Xylariales sp. PMI_506]|nr:carbonic anhydrase [Xylariales sp. PMI_506]
MESTSFVSQFFERNKEYARTHQPIPYFSELPPLHGRPRALIFSCVDSRVKPEVFLGLKPGEATIIKNAGSHVPRNFNDILILDQFAGFTEILVIEHTDCGGTHLTEDGIRKGVLEYAPGCKTETDILQFGTFKDVAGRARDFVSYLKNHPLIREELADKTVGVVYDVKTGEITKVTE